LTCRPGRAGRDDSRRSLRGQTRKLCYTGEVAKQSVVSKNSTGTVIWFDPKACCGFIKPDEGGPDIFARLLRKKGMAMTLAAGNRVSYEPLRKARQLLVCPFQCPSATPLVGSCTASEGQASGVMTISIRMRRLPRAASFCKVNARHSSAVRAATGSIGSGVGGASGPSTRRRATAPGSGVSADVRRV